MEKITWRKQTRSCDGVEEGGAREEEKEEEEGDGTKHNASNVITSDEINLNKVPSTWSMRYESFGVDSHYC